jgi:hypothetical protein
MEPLDFEEWVNVLRRRIQAHAALHPGETKYFKELMSDYADVTPENWYWEAYEELEAQGHISPGASGKVSGDAFATLSADGRYYLRHEGYSERSLFLDVDAAAMPENAKPRGDAGAAWQGSAVCSP